VLPDTESIRPLTQSLPLPDADGGEEVGAALLVGFADVGLASLELPQAATDSAVAPLTARSAMRDRRMVGAMARIGVLSVVGRSERTGSGNDLHDRRRR
jgi:hypothetical protein